MRWPIESGVKMGWVDSVVGKEMEREWGSVLLVNPLAAPPCKGVRTIPFASEVVVPTDRIF